MKDPRYLTEEEWRQIRENRQVHMDLASKSFYWFFHLYFGHYIKYETAEFQKEMMTLASDPEVEQLVITAFRESGKSTLMTTAFPLWAITGHLHKKYVVIFSLTQNQAQQHLANIARELESNELIHKDFWPYDYETNELGVSAINLPKFGARIIAVSREQGVRGLRYGQYRPDLIIADDVEDSKTVKTKESRNNNFRWFTSEVLTLGSEDTKYIVIGNLLHEDSLLMRLKDGIKSGERFGVYREYPIEQKNKAQWPSRFPDKASIKKLERKIGDRISFEREYRLRLISDDEQIITRSMIHYYEKPPTLLRNERSRLVIGVDLALSEKDAADYSAFVLVGIRGSGDNMRFYILPNIINKKMSFPKTVDMVRELNSQYSYAKFYVESTGYQEALVQSVENDLINVKGVKPNVDKRTRLNMIADKIERGVILFPRRGASELITQLIGFGIEKHDDLVDALTTAIIEAVRDERDEENHGSITIIGRVRQV